MKYLTPKTIILLLTLFFAGEIVSQVTPPAPEVEDEEVFMVVEQMPRFPGCEELEKSKSEKEACAQKKMLEYIYGNLKYPAEAREKSIEGQVVIQFVIGKDGSILQPTLIRDVSGGCGEAALEVVKSMNNMPQKWTPGKQRGRAVQVKYTLPVKFKLESNKKTQSSNIEKDKMSASKSFDEEPRFPGCESETDESTRKICSQQELLKFIYSNLEYPDVARKNRIQGTVIIQFMINEDGSLTEINAVRKLEGGCSEAALEVIQKMNNMPNKWIPAKAGGKPVATKYTVPIKFKLAG